MRGNPNFGRKDNVPNLAVNNSTPIANVFAPVADIPNSANVTTLPPISSNPAVLLLAALVMAAIPQSSNPMVAPMEVVEREDFEKRQGLKDSSQTPSAKSFQRRRY